MTTGLTNRRRHLPLSREDETLYSLVGRIRLRNAFRTDLDACRELLGYALTCRIDEYPVDFNFFCEATDHRYGSANQILHQYTVVDYFDWSGTLPWHAGVEKLSAIRAKCGLGELSCGMPRNWRTCPYCRAEEMAQYGCTYWHLSHQLPITLVCSKHQEYLQYIPTSYFGIRNRLLLPHEVFPIDEIVESGSGTKEHLIRLAKLDEALLHDARHAVSNNVVFSALEHALIERDLVDRRHRLKQKAFSSCFATYLAKLSLFESWQPLADIRMVQKTTSALINKKFFNAVHFPLLIDFLFGSWPAFRERCEWEDVLSLVHYYEHAQSKSPEISGQQRHRQVCLTLLENYPLITRNEFARAAPKSFRWLLRYEARWLDGVLPKASKLIQYKLFR